MGAGISKANAYYVADYRGNMPLIDAIDDLDDISAYTRKQCRSLSTHFANMRNESAGKAVYRILHYMGYLDYMRDHGLDSGKVEILQLLANEEEKLDAFLPRLVELKEMITEGVGNHNSRFILSTIHSSKGLEYDTVYMLDMLEGILPSISEPKGKDADPADIALYEEERRLFYVGMTRAKNALYVYTFDPAETSAFSKNVFTSSTGTAKSFDLSPYKRVETKQKSDVEFRKMLEDYEQGVIVCHKKYGKGAVVERENNIADIYFEGIDEVKKIALEVAVPKGLLKLV